ncbi:ferric reductase NAD binding domain-containing protein [Delphinella strobiligena]|nr:ferric reductase NAD binding domain-containing protein [Delphinella strobiligena]
MLSTPYLLFALLPCTLAAVSSEEAEADNRNANSRYGYAFYGFWGGIMLIGILHNIWKQAYAIHCKHSISDVEKNGKAVPRSYSQFIDVPRHWVRTYLIQPPAFGTHHARLLGWCTIPLRLPALVIVAYWILTIILLGVGYEYTAENVTLDSTQRWKDFANRCAILLISNLPILWMFAGRNNIFIWATGWNFQTFNIFHRHIARVVILLAIGHSAVYTHSALQMGIYKSDFKEGWFAWGVAATTAFGFFWLTSLSWIRRKFYEVFLFFHIGLGIVVIYGTFKHTTKEDGAFNAYLWPLVAIWGFDRFMRLVRIVVCNLHVTRNKHSIRTSSCIAEYDHISDVIKIQVQTSGLKLIKPCPGHYYFLYQPGSLRFYENHPFTAAAWSNEAPSLAGSDEESDPSSPPTPTEKNTRIDSLTPALAENTTAQTLSFWIRPYDGWTRRLRNQCTKSPSSVCYPRLLVEGPYGGSENLHAFDTVIFIAGGTGITAAVPYIKDHLHRSHKGASRITDMKLIWSSRRATFVKLVCDEKLAPMLSLPEFKMEVFLTNEDGAQEDVQQGQISLPRQDSQDTSRSSNPTYQYGRVDMKKIIDDAVREISPDSRCAIFVCGPAAMADEARAASHAAMKAGCRNLEYFEDDYGW